jgi:hypothetical protein
MFLLAEVIYLVYESVMIIIVNINSIVIKEDYISRLKQRQKKEYNVKYLLGNNNISQSQSIKFGKIFESIVKDIIKESGGSIIEDNFFNIYDIEKSEKGHANKGCKDADILFIYKKSLYYFECKTNLNLDSEKSKQTDKKVEDFTNYFRNNKKNRFMCEEVKIGILTCWFELEKDLPNKVNNVFFMKDFFNIFNISIQKQDYYNAFRKLGEKL